jgi:hypothetical protein
VERIYLHHGNWSLELRRTAMTPVDAAGVKGKFYLVFVEKSDNVVLTLWGFRVTIVTVEKQ